MDSSRHVWLATASSRKSPGRPEQIPLTPGLVCAVTMIWPDEPFQIMFNQLNLW